MQDMKNNHDTSSLKAFRNEVNNYSPLLSDKWERFTETYLLVHDICQVDHAYMISTKNDTSALKQN
jgi:hypothetical protein